LEESLGVHKIVLVGYSKLLYFRKSKSYAFIHIINNRKKNDRKFRQELI
jgi:hypothetical protein